MVDYTLRENIKTIVFEDASRLARDLFVQEMAFKELTNKGYKLIAANRPDMFLDKSISSKLVRQMIGAFHEFEKCSLVEKLRGARNRAKRNTKERTLDNRPKVEGKKSRLDGPDGPKMKRNLKNFAEKVKLAPGDATKARNALHKKGLRTAQGKEFSLTIVKTWIRAVRARFL